MGGTLPTNETVGGMAPIGAIELTEAMGPVGLAKSSPVPRDEVADPSAAPGRACCPAGADGMFCVFSALRRLSSDMISTSGAA